MFDFAWSEMAVIGVVALVVIGPKDLPRVLRTAGIMMRRARGLAREFQNSIDDMIREAEMQEFRKEIQETRQSLEQAARVDLNAPYYGDYSQGGDRPASASDAPLPYLSPGDEPPTADDGQLDLDLVLPRHQIPHPSEPSEIESPPMVEAMIREPDLPLAPTTLNGPCASENPHVVSEASPHSTTENCIMAGHPSAAAEGHGASRPPAP